MNNGWEWGDLKGEQSLGGGPEIGRDLVLWRTWVHGKAGLGKSQEEKGEIRLKRQAEARSSEQGLRAR